MRTRRKRIWPSRIASLVVAYYMRGFFSFNDARLLHIGICMRDKEKGEVQIGRVEYLHVPSCTEMLKVYKVRTDGTRKPDNAG